MYPYEPPPRAWPHGSWTTPPLVTLLVFATGSILAVPAVRDTVPWWSLALGTAALVPLAWLTTGLYVLEQRVREKARAYAVVAATTTAGWLNYARAVSPIDVIAACWLGASLLVLWPIYGYFRSEHRSRIEELAAVREEHQEQVRAAKLENPDEDDESDWPAVLRAANIKGMAEVDQVPTPAGVTVHLRAVTPTDLTTLIGNLSRIEAAAANRFRGRMVIQPGSITAEQGATAADFVLHVQTQDVLALTIPLPEETGPTSIAKPWTPGIFKDGRLVSVVLLYLHGLIVGMTDAGKSNLVNLLIWYVTRCTDAVLWFGAPNKFWPVAAAWLECWMKGRTKTPIFDWPAPSLAELERMVVSAYRAIDMRQRIPRKGDKLVPSAQNPAIVMLIDEAAAATNSKRKIRLHTGEEMLLGEAISRCEELGRSEMVIVLLVNPRAVETSLGQFAANYKASSALKIGLRTEKASDGHYLFGDGKGVGGVDTTTLEHSGSFFIRFKRMRAMAAKAYYIDPENIPTYAENHTRYLSSLPAELADALGPDYTERWSAERAAEIYAYARGDVDALIAAGVATVAQPEATKQQQPGAHAVSTAPPASTGGAGGAFGAVPDLAASLNRRLAEQGVPTSESADSAPPPVETDKTGGGGGGAEDDTFAALAASFTVADPRGEVPEPLATLVAKFADREFVSSADLASAVGMDSAALGLALSRKPFEVRRRESGTVRRPEYGGEPVRGYFMADLHDVARAFRRGERTG